MSKERTAREIAQELYEHRHDPGEWAEEDAPITVRPSETAVVSCRLPKEEFRALRAAARAAQESISDYVRAAIQARLATATATPTVVPLNLRFTERSEMREVVRKDLEDLVIGVRIAG